MGGKWKTTEITEISVHVLEQTSQNSWNIETNNVPFHQNHKNTWQTSFKNVGLSSLVHLSMKGREGTLKLKNNVK